MKNLSITKILLFYLFVLLLVGYFSPKKIDWSPSYSKDHSKPFGTNILFNELGHIFQKKITTNQNPLFNNSLDSIESAFNYIIINKSFYPDSLDRASLLNYVHNGANVFIAAEQIDYKLLDTLNLNLEFYYNSIDELTALNAKTINVGTVSNFDNTDSIFQYRVNKFYETFENRYDSLECYIPLSWIDTFSSNNFILKEFGKGKFYLHSMPKLFTNYHMLVNDNHRYIAKVFSHLENKNIIWDEYYKIKKPEKQRSVLRVFLSEPSFKWLYWLLLASVFFFMIFHSKRKQRAIPVIEPPKNESLNFIKRIANLYFQNANHHDLAIKKITILQEYIHRKYYLSNLEFSNREAILLSKKSANEEREILTLFEYVTNIKNCTKINRTQLKKLNHLINEFYHRK